jgi:hypothetical protein
MRSAGICQHSAAAPNAAGDDTNGQPGLLRAPSGGA